MIYVSISYDMYVRTLVLAYCLFGSVCLFVCLFVSIPFLYFKKKSGIDKSTERSMIPACPGLVCFLNRGNAEGTGSLKSLCLTFVYVLLYINLCQD